MGRPSVERKRAKRRRQKQKRSNMCTHRKALSMQIDNSIPSSVNDSSLCHVSHTKPIGSPVTAPTSPLLFSDPQFDVDPTAETSHAFSHHINKPESSCYMNDADSSNVIGDVDTDLIEMDIYDLYRREDGKTYSNEYLHKCRDKLRRKAQQDRIEINQLQRESMQLKLRSACEKERIRMFYETIAFGRSRTGRIVRSAIGTSTAAGEIIKELETLYSVDQDSNYQ